MIAEVEEEIIVEEEDEEVLDLTEIEEIEDEAILEEELENVAAALEEDNYDMDSADGVNEWYADYAAQ